MPNGIRKILFWTHLSAGVVAGVVILIMCVTGVLLAFQRQVTDYVDRRNIAAAVNAAAANPLTVEELLERVSKATGSTPTAITVYRDTNRAFAIEFGRERTVFVDPYSGAIVGEASRGVRRFFRLVTDWHRWLAASQESRQAGRAITGACNLLFLFIVLSGPFLWLPRKWSWSNVKAVLWFRGGLGGKARDFNWHNVVGVWSAIPLAVLVATAVVMSYAWANNALYKMTGTQPPPVQQGREEAGRSGRAPQAEGLKRIPQPSFSGFEVPLAKAKEQDPTWQQITLRLPSRERPIIGPNGDEEISFTIVNGYEGRPDRRAQLVLARGTGEVVRWEPFSGNNAGRRLRIWFRFLHTGEALGTAGQAVAAMASAGGALLVYTGIALMLRRFVAWNRRRKNQPELKEEPVTV